MVVKCRSCNIIYVDIIIDDDDVDNDNDNDDEAFLLILLSFLIILPL